MTNPLVFGACDLRCGGIARRDYGTGLTPYVSAWIALGRGTPKNGRLFYQRWRGLAAGTVPGGD